MAYTINRTDGTLFATVADGTINTNSSLVMVGKNYAGYGESLNENFFRLLESHANPTPPVTPQQGQLWYDTSLGLLKIWNTAEWKDLGSSAAGVIGPTEPVTGDSWYDTTNSQLNVWDGTKYVLIGPSFSSGTGTTGYIVETLTDGVLDHVVIKVVVGDGVVAIVSKDSVFTPVPAQAGFTTIQPGYNLINTGVTATDPLFIGTATNAELLEGIPSADFLSSVTNDTTSGSLGIIHNDGLSVGLLSEAQISVDGFDAVTFQNHAVDGDIIFTVNDGGAPTPAIVISGVNARAQVLAPVGGTDIANMAYVESAIVAADSQPADNFVTEANDTDVIDFAGATVSLTSLTANATLTSVNLAAGLRRERIFVASGADRTVTLNASWHSFGEASPIVIPSGKSMVLSMTATTTTEAGIYCAAVLEN